MNSLWLLTVFNIRELLLACLQLHLNLALLQLHHLLTLRLGFKLHFKLLKAKLTGFDRTFVEMGDGGVYFLTLGLWLLGHLRGCVFFMTRKVTHAVDSLAFTHDFRVYIGHILVLFCSYKHLFLRLCRFLGTLKHLAWSLMRRSQVFGFI